MPAPSDAWSSPFSWRYGSPEMRSLWGERQKHLLWRRVWVALAEAQAELGLVREEQVADLRAHAQDVDLERAAAIEAELQHDLMAELSVYASQCAVGGGVIHLGATSMDIEDNADAMRIADALDQILTRLGELLTVATAQIEALADAPSMAFTHLQPAEPTTMGYRLAQHSQDLLQDLHDLRQMRREIRGKGFKGAVGTSASYKTLLGGGDPAELERRVMSRLGLPAFTVATQVAPRKQELRVLNTLASAGQSLYKLAADLRLLQSPPFGEWAEPFGKKQVGSSAMPFKRNPIHAENIDSLTRHLAALPRVAWDNAAHCYLERTLDDSANRRSILPEAFIILDESLGRATRILKGLRIDSRAAGALLDQYGPFAATERVMMELARRGGDRQALHHTIREHSLAAWAALRDGGPNPVIERVCAEPEFLALASEDELRGWLDARGYVGDAPERARRLAQEVRDALETPQC
jgi:adenylosuccinate lyase